jgi:hypothetical protein
MMRMVAVYTGEIQSIPRIAHIAERSLRRKEMMTGRKVPRTHERALAYMVVNEVFGKRRRRLKGQARKEDRMELKREDRDESIDYVEYYY